MEYRIPIKKIKNKTIAQMSLGSSINTEGAEKEKEHIRIHNLDLEEQKI